MVVSTMTYYEKYESYFKDLNKITIKCSQLKAKVIRELRKCNKFPYYKTIEYSLPQSGNRYILYFWVEDKSGISKPFFDFFSILETCEGRCMFVKWGCTPYSHRNGDPFVWTRKIEEYTMHFMARYRTRYCRDEKLSLIDVACRYFSRNSRPILTRLNENIMNHYLEYGNSAHNAFKVKDGLCLTRLLIEENINAITGKRIAVAIGVTNVTFVDNKMLKKNQIVALFKENVSYMSDLFKSELPYIDRSLYR